MCYVYIKRSFLLTSKPVKGCVDILLDAKSFPHVSVDMKTMTTRGTRWYCVTHWKMNENGSSFSTFILWICLYLNCTYPHDTSRSHLVIQTYLQYHLCGNNLTSLSFLTSLCTSNHLKEVFKGHWVILYNASNLLSTM